MSGKESKMIIRILFRGPFFYSQTGKVCNPLLDRGEVPNIQERPKKKRGRDNLLNPNPGGRSPRKN